MPESSEACSRGISRRCARYRCSPGRREHADALNRDGLRVSGKSERRRAGAGIDRSAGAARSRRRDRRDQGDRSAGSAWRRSRARSRTRPMTTVLNGLGAEEIVREHGDWPIVSAVTFMSGTQATRTRTSSTSSTPRRGSAPTRRRRSSSVQEIADTIVASGLRAEALPDLRPAQWSKLIFNAAVNPVAALTGLPHDPHFAAEDETDRPRPPRAWSRRRGQGGCRRPRGSSCTTIPGR